MQRIILIQLPIPQTNFGRQTGNVPLAGAVLKQATQSSSGLDVEIVPESVSSYLGDAALLDHMLSRQPDIVGFTVYSWNLDRSLHLAASLKRHGNIKIVLGGPEITSDNPRLTEDAVDFLVYGEGESVFKRLISDPNLWADGSSADAPDDAFESSPSPYPAGLLEPELENSMLLETQRGCPYRCGYCYYNKGRRRLTFAAEPQLLEAIDWAIQRGLAEIYLLDPCLTARPGLRDFLQKLALRNRDRCIGFNSEIRAEHVDESLADLFRAAGFLWFEIGLQSTNPKALDTMNRPTDLERFTRGAGLLKERDILPMIDLILGLLGDDLDGFRRSVDFVVDHGLADDVQVFPLSILPGTDFRQRSGVLGLRFTPDPPYTVIETPAFSQKDMLAALDYAEAGLDTALYSLPSPDIAWQKDGEKIAGDVLARIGQKKFHAKVYIDKPRSRTELRAIANTLAHPYQIYVDGGFTDHLFLCRLVSAFSGANPFTPFEIVFLSPKHLPDRKRLLDATRLKRPHFLDIEQRFLFPDTGNRAVTFTLVSENRESLFKGEMERQVFWWKAPALPTRQDLDGLFDFDGVLIDTPLPEAEIVDWQDRFSQLADDIAHISFPRIALQNRWLMNTAADEYAPRLLDGLAQ